MIAYIRGKLVDKQMASIIVDVQGVGYGIFMPAQAVEMLPPIGEEITIHTYLNVREDAMHLFGFLTRDDLQVFRLVISVSGIGPKGGLSILSKLTPDDLRIAVMTGDVKAISAAPGIGKKTAEKLIIELKDKLHLEDVLKTEDQESHSNYTSGIGIIQSEAVQALVALGYSNAESLKAVGKITVTPEISVEDVLKQALKNMMF
ncbi:MAG: Holliday junction branch migration protein RuvA [Lachnospiraceae bacterium]